MRRGRPKNLTTEHQTLPSVSPARPVNSDPFAALDSSPSSTLELNNIDEASARFPSLDQFSLLHDSGNKFAFEQKAPQTSGQPKDISQRVTEALADDAFALAPTSQKDLPIHTKSLPSAAGRKAHAATQTLSPSQGSTEDRPAAKASNMVSTGTMTSPLSPANGTDVLSRSPRPTFRFSSDRRSSSQPRASVSPARESIPTREWVLPSRPTLSDQRSKSQIATFTIAKPSTSSRPSLEGRRPQGGELDELPPRSMPISRSRPVSAHLESAARLLRARSPSQNKQLDSTPPERLISDATGTSDTGAEGTQIASNVDFLRAMEEEDPGKRKEKRYSSGSKHVKRTSISSISLSGTKSMLAGRFGDAFKRFETNNESKNHHDDFPDSNDLTPIAGSEATDGRSDDGRILEETEDVPPEVRREIERRRLSQEERRVTEAAAVYKQQVADGTTVRGRESSRATLIQNKVQALLDGSGKASPTKTAEGYGRFTALPRPDSGLESPQLDTGRRNFQAGFPATRSIQPPTSSSSAPAVDRPFRRPSAPPKPQALRTGGRGGPQAGPLSPAKATKPNHLSGRPAPSPSDSQSGGTVMSPEDWEATFSKRYPSLSGLEMVETEIDRVPPNARGV